MVKGKFGKTSKSPTILFPKSHNIISMIVAQSWIGRKKESNRKPRAVIVKFASYNTRKQIFFK